MRFCSRIHDIEAAMGNEIAKRIAESKQKLPGLGKKEKAANREAVKALAAVHMEQAVKELSRIISDKTLLLRCV